MIFALLTCFLETPLLPALIIAMNQLFIFHCCVFIVVFQRIGSAVSLLNLSNLDLD